MTAKYIVEAIKLSVLVLFCILFSENVSAQSPSIILNTQVNGGQNHSFVARDRVILKNGAKFKPNTAAFSFKGKINESIVLPVAVTSTVNFPLRSSLNTNLEVGTLPVVSTVTDAGQASISFPILAPPGTAGMQPSIGVQYISQHEGGVLGYGWDISGLSVISRVGNNQYFDGTPKSIDLSMNDNFAYNGQRLLIASGTNATDGATYISESESFNLITSRGSAPGGPAWFSVQSKSGIIMEFGNSPDSKIIATTGAILIWKINKIQDPNGNYLIFKYKQDVNESVIEKIEYTGNTLTNTLPYNSIQFYYDRKSDVSEKYIVGEKIRSSLILRQIKTFAESNLAHAYEFKYGKDIYSKLIEIEEIGANGERYNSTRINWEAEGVNTIPYSPINNWPILGKGDIDGDGRTDIVLFDYVSMPKKVYVQFATNPTPQLIPYYITTDIAPKLSLLDFNNDNADEIYISASTVDHNFIAFSYNKLTNFFVTETNSITNVTFPFSSSGTFFNEGVILTKISPFGRFGDEVVLANKVLRNPENRLYHEQLSIPFGNFTNILHPNLVSTQRHRLRFFDMNGNGKTDIIELVQEIMIEAAPLPPPPPAIQTIEVPKRTFIRIYEVSDLTGKYEVIYSSDELLGEEDFIDFGDFNADGNIDLLVHSDTWKSYRYDGVEFIGEGMSQLDGVIGESISVSVNDFDGDGKADILCNLPSPAVPVVEALEKVCKAIINPNYLNSSTNYNGLFNKIRKDVLEVYQNAIDNNLPFAFQLDQDIVSLLREFFLPRAHFSDFSMFIEGSSVKHSPAFNALKLIVISEHQSTFSPTKSWWDKFTAFWGVEKAVYNWGNPHAVRENPSIVIYKSNGADFVPSTYLIEGFQSVQQSMFSDFNGDGMCDVYSSLYLNYIFTPRINLFDNQKLSHFVATVTDGLNNHIEFRYASITGQGGGLLHYSGSSTQLTNPQLSLCTAPLYVVTNLYSITSEQSILSQTSFRYYDALFHKAGKGFLGFRKIGRLHYQASDYGIATLTTNVLDPTYFFLYPLRSETKALTSSGSINSVFDALTTFCQPVSTIEYEFEFDGSYYAVGVIGKHYCFRPKLQLSTDYLTGIASKVEYLNYDGFGNVTEVKNSFQNSGTTTTTTFTYDIFGSWCPNHVLQQSTTFKRTNEYDITRVVNHAYDSKGNLTSIQNFPSLPKSTTVSYQYNLSGLLIEKRIASQGKVRITKQEYDSKNRFVIKEFNALNQKTERTYDSKYGSVLGLTDIDNKTITYVYNGLGRLIQSSDKNDITAIHTKAWEGSTPQQSLYVDYVVRPNEPVSKVWTDNIGRLIKTTVSGIENTTTVTYQYDNRVLTRLKKKSKPFLSTATKFEEYQYDIYNRSITSIDEGRVTNINYGSIPSKETITTFITDPNDLSKNSVSSVKIGNDGYVEERTDNGGVIAYAYYADGQTKSILNNTFTNFTYDDYGRQQTLDDPNAGLTSYEYNGFGELTKQTNPNLNTIVMEYDNAGRVTKKTLNANNPAIAEVTVYNYVPSGNGVNQLLTVSNPNVSQTFTYDNLGRTVSVTENIQNINYTTSFEYNDRGLNTKVTYPSGFSVTKEYDAIGRLYLIKQSDNNQPIWRANQYNNHEMLTQAILGNGMKYNYSYDANNILTGISMQNLSNSIIYNQSYQFDFSTGNLKLRKDLLKLKPGTSIPFQEEFEYDNLNRLFENKVNGVTQTNVTYSPNGNIATKSDVSDDQWQYHHIKTNAVIGISNLKPNIVVPSFNLNIQYNSANRPTYITDNYGTKALTIIYGPDDQRRKTKYVNAGIVVKENIFVGNYEKEVTPNLTKEYHYIQGPNGLVGVYIRSNGTNLGMYYACTDHLGSINALVNSSGVIVEEYSTDPWGKRRNPSDWTTATTSLPVYLSRCFTGHEHLDEFGIINMNARLYDPTIGRMLSPDNYVQSPDNTQSFNRYSYAWNNPVNYTDPSGDFIIEAMLVAGMLNLAANMFNGNVREMVSWKAAGYFAVGAAAGAAGYGVGAGLSSVIGTGGFIGGGVVSGGAGFSSGFAIGTGNNLLNGRSVSESIGGGLQYGLTAAISGFFIGGAIAGTDALLKGRSFWNGQYTRTYLRENGINFTGDAVSESELGEYVANKFANRINQMEYMPDISVNDAEVTKLASSKTAAVTIPSNGNYKLAGASKIYLRSGALSSDKKLFYVLDHELVHATHYSDGSFATWENLFGLQKAIALSEVYAYKSSILMSHKLGLPWTQWSYDLMMQYYGSFTK